MRVIIIWMLSVSSVFGQVAFDAASESHTGTTASENESSFSWTHTPAGDPAGVIIAVYSRPAGVDHVVEYGGIELAPDADLIAVDGSGEPAYVYVYALGSGVPSGPQTVQVTRTNNGNQVYAVCYTVTSSANVEPVSGTAVVEESDQTLTEEDVDDESPGTNSLRMAFVYSGTASLLSVGANSTLGPGIDIGSHTFNSCYETTPGQGERPVGFTNGSTDDVAAVYVAIRQVTSSRRTFIVN